MKITHAISAAILAGGLAVTAAIPATASPAAPAPATPAARTCAAFTAWEHSRTLRDLDAMLTASEGLAWGYLDEDAMGLYEDAKAYQAKPSAKTAAYIAKDIRYTREDC